MFQNPVGSGREMTALGPIEEDVKFAWGPAAALSAQLRRAARTLDDSIPRLSAAAHHAKQDWHGAYARRFDDHMRKCTTDARRFAAAMEAAAQTLDELADLAHKEQQRREIARAWQTKHEEWERHHHGVWGDIADLFGGGDPEPQPPDLPEITPHPRVAEAPATSGRE
jgi:uncharacterized protein YukE